MIKSFARLMKAKHDRKVRVPAKKSNPSKSLQKKKLKPLKTNLISLKKDPNFFKVVI